ncbi:T9SS type A sorting domain-containing protein [Flavobacterium sp. NG2]|uniref:T9SS type A sorting domain-containing protein n=1 Tax=Flavobacterium sp. NG2 TaxID=3097547 RepID=UPI002A7FEBE9|nr:T9SS type A sorting domain-containing protein [Flavobacterium sp. NG2]WPR71979.1 T9SS type A sorting domain-containing protein [Flavobacterium sp. NG2]
MKKNYIFGKKKTVMAVFMVLVCGMFANNVWAQATYTWVGGTTGNWSDPANWTSAPDTPGTVPGNNLGDIVNINEGVCNYDVASTTIKQLTLGSTVTGSSALTSQGVLNIAVGNVLTVTHTGAALTIKGGKLNNLGTLNLNSGAANVTILCQKPTNTNPLLDTGYAGAGILVATTSTSGGFVNFNNFGTASVPVLELNAATTTINLDQSFTSAAGVFLALAGGRGKIAGTGIIMGTSLSPTKHRLFNITGGSTSASTDFTNIEVATGTTIKGFCTTDTNTTAITFAGATGTTANLDNKGTIIMEGGYSAGIIGNTTVTSNLLNSGTITFNTTLGTVNAINNNVSTLVNTGTINTNAGTTYNTDIKSVTNTFTSGKLSPGGDVAKGVMNIAGSSVAFGTTTLRMNVAATASGVAGTDFDQINATVAAASINLTGTVIDLTGISSNANTTVDIITTNAGTITGTPTFSPALPLYWTASYPGSKVVLTYNNPTLSVKKQNAFEFSVYPNPVSEVLYIQTQEVLKSAQVIDASGKVVLTQNKPSESINVSSLKKGIYMLRLTSEKGVSTSKIVKK